MQASRSGTGADLEVHTDAVVALLGANAAGKGTLLQAVSGVLRPCRGMIAFAGQDVTWVASVLLAGQNALAR